jgi:hypothetical protein
MPLIIVVWLSVPTSESGGSRRAAQPSAGAVPVHAAREVLEVDLVDDAEAAAGRRREGCRTPHAYFMNW